MDDALRRRGLKAVPHQGTHLIHGMVMVEYKCWSANTADLCLSKSLKLFVMS